jgi:hypothetical protein
MSSISPRDRLGRPTPVSICAAEAPRTLSAPKKFRNAVVAKPSREPQLLRLTAAAAVLRRRSRVRADDVGVQRCLVALAREAQNLRADTGVGEIDVGRVDQRGGGLPLGESLNCVRERAQRPAHVARRRSAERPRRGLASDGGHGQKRGRPAALRVSPYGDTPPPLMGRRAARLRGRVSLASIRRSRSV